jgi:hypothetical protein
LRLPVISSSLPARLTYSFRSKSLRSVVASASASGSRPGLRSLAVLRDALRACAFRSPSPRTGNQLQLRSRAAYQLARNVTLGLRREPHASGSADDSISGLHRIFHPSAKLATSFRLSVGCRTSGLRRLPASRLLPFPESFSRVLVGLPACAGPQLPHPAVSRPGISSIAGSLGLRFEFRGLRRRIPLTGLW